MAGNAFVYLCTIDGEAAMRYYSENLKYKGVWLKIYSTEHEDEYMVFVDESHAAKAKDILADRQGVVYDSEMEGCVAPKTAYIDGCSEWSDKMYVHGYYTGGRIPHFVVMHSGKILVIIALIITLLIVGLV